MANNKLVVEVIGDSSKLDLTLKRTQAETERWARRMKNSGAGNLLGDTRSARLEGEKLTQALQAQRVASAQAGLGYGALAARAGIAGFAISQVVGGVRDLTQAMKDSDGKVREFGRLIEGLTQGHPGEAGSAIDNILGNRFERDIDFAVKGLFGIDRAAQRAKASFEAMWAAAHPPASLDLTKLQTDVFGGKSFGITPLDSLLGKDKGKARAGVTTSQRNTFFDNSLNRALDRAQDGSPADQLAKLQAISNTITQRLAVTKDITRKLRLEDELVAVGRQRQGIIDQVRVDAAQRAAELKRLAEQQEDERKERERKRLEVVQSRQFRALGFDATGGDLTPSAANLRKQIGTLTNRLGSSFEDTGRDVTLSSKLSSQLEGARKVLSGKFGEITKESRDRIRELFDTIRDEFDKQGKGPLTATHQLNSAKILDGLGLDREQVRQATARLSHFNTAGVGLGATGSAASGRPIIVKMQVDGRTVAEASAPALTVIANKRGRRNPEQTRGRNF